MLLYIDPICKFYATGDLLLSYHEFLSFPDSSQIGMFVLPTCLFIYLQTDILLYHGYFLLLCVAPSKSEPQKHVVSLYHFKSFLRDFDLG